MNTQLKQLPVWFRGLIDGEPPASFDEIDGSQFGGRYTLRALIAQTGMSLVFLAADEQLDREVVLKVPIKKLNASMDRFVAEAKVVAELDHPNIVPIYDIAFVKDHPFVTYRRILGQTLSEKTQTGISVAQAIDWTALIAEALQHAHEHDVYHRDVKPANIIVDKKGVPFLLDFGVAIRESNVDHEEQFMTGTLPYMAPEQVLPMSAALDGRTDVYGLGVVLYEILSGRRPFRADNPTQLTEKILTKSVRPIRQLNSDVPSSVEQICTRCLHKKPRDRYQSAAGLRDALAAASASLRSGDNSSIQEGKNPNGKSLNDAMTHTDSEADEQMMPGLPDRLPTPTANSSGNQTSKRTLGLIYAALAATLALLGTLIVFNWPSSGSDPDKQTKTNETDTGSESKRIPPSSGTDASKKSNTASATESLSMVKTFAYVLQADAAGKTRKQAIAQLRDCDRDLIILDATFDGDESGRWKSQELNEIRAGKVGRRVVAYCSIGEAESYRSYWNDSWDENEDGKPGESAPNFLQSENANWSGNYRVRYWGIRWKNIVFEQVDTIIGQGFDGIFLDRVDAFEDYEQISEDEYQSNRENSVTGQSYRKDMLDLVFGLAGRARSKTPGFLIVPQNGAQLLEDSAYADLASGIAIEELLFLDDQETDSEDRQDLVDLLENLGDGKPVLLVEYVAASKFAQCKQAALKLKYRLLMTTKQLEEFGTSPVDF